MSGNSILMNGNSIVEFYGVDLEKLTEEDRVGVMRTNEVNHLIRNILYIMKYDLSQIIL